MLIALIWLSVLGPTPQFAAAGDDDKASAEGDVRALEVAYTTIGAGTATAPLRINVGADTSYQVFYNYNDGTSVTGQLYPPSAALADVGTFLWINGQIYGPNFLGHASSAPCAEQVGATPYTQLSQTQTGSGALADPFKVVTRVQAGSVVMEETVTLVNGNRFHDISRKLTNTGGGTTNVTIFHAADLYLKGSDNGYGFYDTATRTVGGLNQARTFREAFTPVETPARYQEAAYCENWRQIGLNGTPGGGLTNAVLAPDVYVDNGIALRWDRTLAPAGTTTVADIHTFSIPDCVSASTGLNICDLRKGDILLEHGKLDNFDSVVISGVGFSYWQHAAIYDGNGGTTGDILEAAGHAAGIRRVPVRESSFFTGDGGISDVVVLRPAPEHQAKINGAVSWANAVVDGPAIYNGDFLDPSNRTRNDSFYCSMFVWRAYQEQGLDLYTPIYLPMIGGVLGAAQGISHMVQLLSQQVFPDDLYGSAIIRDELDVVQDRNPSAQRLLLIMLSPANMHLSDDAGNAIGAGAVAPTLPPGAFYSGATSEPEAISVLGVDGTAHIDVRGTGTGNYTLVVQSIGQQRASAELLVGNTQPDQVDEYEVPNTATQPVSIRPTPGNAIFSLATTAGGTVTPPAGGPSYPLGTVLNLTAEPAPGHVFAGWFVDGTLRNWRPEWSLTLNASHRVRAVFAPLRAFPDVPTGRADRTAITELASRGYILGYANGNYGPDDGVQRSQMAALVARAIPSSGQSNNLLTPPNCLIPNTWDCENWGNRFQDRNGLDGNLWRNIGTLQHYGVAIGYSGSDCTSRGVASPCYGPNDPVTYAQTISFITRAMKAKGYWVDQPGQAHPYAGVPAAHEVDVRTFYFYTQANGGITAPPSNWNAQATRGWFALALWVALDSHFGE
jgi:hypothetical protein